MVLLYIAKGRKIMRDIRENILQYLQIYQENPLNFIPLIIDLVIVIFLGYNLLKIVKDSRAWQLVKGIALLVVATWLSRMVKLKYTKLHLICCNELGSYTINNNLPTRDKKSIRTIRYK